MILLGLDRCGKFDPKANWRKIKQANEVILCSIILISISNVSPEMLLSATDPRGKNVDGLISDDTKECNAAKTCRQSEARYT